MKITILLATFALLTFAGCSKSSDGDVAAGDDAPAEVVADPKVSAQLSAVPNQIQDGNYDAAVAALMQAEAAAKSEEERRAVELQMRQAQDMLLEQAKNDAKARETYNNLGRMKMGR